jgi:hypothetical protein
MSKAELAALFLRRDEWLQWIAIQLRTENGQRLARGADVSPHTALALANVVGNCGSSFAKQGIFASQETLAARLAKWLVRDKADVRLVRRATKLLVKVGALRVETSHGKPNLLVPLLAGKRLHDAVETKREGGTAASATPDASVRSTPDATVPEPRTPASYKSSYENIQRGKNINKLPPTPQWGMEGEMN